METIKTKHGVVHICDSQGELSKVAADDFVKIVNEAIARTGRATVGLSGGHTPPLLYERLTSEAYKKLVDWKKVHFFISDERCVPEDSKDSNWGNAQRQLFNKLHVPAENLHPLQNQDIDPKGAAEKYEEELKKFFDLKPGELPRFDLIQLGMGPDGHTASLFPGSKALSEKKRAVVDNFVDKSETWRITFTFSVLNEAGNIMFMVEGQEKSHVLSEVLQGTSGAPQYPVQNVTPHDGKIVWFVDRAAARDLKVKV